MLLCAFQHFSGKFSGRLHWAVYNFWKGIFQVPSWVTEKMQETRLTVFCSYLGLEHQTICRCHSLGGSTLSSDILRLREMVQSRAWTLDFRRSTTWTKQAAVFERFLTFSYAFHPLHRHWHTRYNWHLGCSYGHKQHNPLLTKSENRMLMDYVWKTHLS